MSSSSNLLEILSRLPPDSLLRFKLASKTWYSLISNTDFLCRNTANQFDRRRCRINDHPPPPGILFELYQLAGDSRILILPPPPPLPNEDDQPYYDCHHQKLSPLLLQNLIDYRPAPDGDQKKGRHFMLLDSCNGLLLYRNSHKNIFSPIREYTLYVCNPITHDYIKLPTLFEQEEREQGFEIRNYSPHNIVFDPSASLAYKVVIWLTCTTTKEQEEHEYYRLYVYSSVTRSWRLNQFNQFPNPLIFNFKDRRRGVLCNGVLYWSTKCPSFDTKISLCRYDVEKDVISFLRFPKMPLEYSYRQLLYFGECGGRLRLIETYHKESDLQLQLQFGDEIYVLFFRLSSM